MDINCIVDIASREVSFQENYRIAAYDHNVDVIHFSVEPIEDFSLDLSSIKIAALGPNKARHDYTVDPSTVSIEEETGYITFDWPIPAGVTEMPIGSGFKYGDRGQLIFAVCAEIISGSTVSKAWHSDDGIITVVAHLEPEAGGGEDPEEEATNAQKIGQLQTDVAVINTQVGALANGSPTPVETIAEMTDESAVYLYTGSETGYIAGNWYFWNGSAWTSGGTYGGAVTDTTLSISGAPADAKAVGDALALKADSADVTALDTKIQTAVITETETTIGELIATNVTAINDLTITGATQATIRNTQIFESKYPGTSSSYGMSITKNDDGSYTINGLATSNAFFHLNQTARTGIDNVVALDGTYTFFLDIMSGSYTNETYTGGTSGIFCVKNGLDTNTLLLVAIGTNSSSNKVTRNITTENAVIAFRSTNGVRYNNFRFRIMLNKGDKALPWTAYKTPQTVTAFDDLESVASEYLPDLWISTTPSTAEISLEKVTSTKDRFDEVENGLASVSDKLNDTLNYANPNVISANHRGYHNRYPENTLWAFAQSKLRGFEWIENDVRLTSDGVGVLLHDETINRTARNVDGTEIEETIYIADITYEQVLAYDFGIYAGEQFAGTKICTIEECIRFCKSVGLSIFCEPKVQGAGTLCANLVKKYAMQDNVYFISFGSTTLSEALVVLPKSTVGLLTTQDLSDTFINTAISLKTADNSVFIDIDYRKTVSDAHLAMLMTNNVGLAVYTLDDSSALETLSPYVFAITSNTLVANRKMAELALAEYV